MAVSASSPTHLYAGIGSRQTPVEVLKEMVYLGRALAHRGYTLRSGAALGADTAFERGCDELHGNKEIWIPWMGYESRPALCKVPGSGHYQIASETHPAWQYLSRGVRGLHARNVGQVLGEDLLTPVSFVLCWTPDGAESHSEVTRETGGTGTAIKLAALTNIPVINMQRGGHLERLRSLLNGSCCVLKSSEMR